MKGNINKLTLKVSEIKNNPSNPRLIKDDKFKKLVVSLKEFPIMAKKLRKVVIDEDNIILGGNMRFKALKQAGFKEVAVEYFTREDAEENNKLAKEINPDYVDKTYEEQCREFVIKDNVSGGEWDWDLLANEWNAEELDEWGLDTPDDWGEEKKVEEDEAPEVDESEPPKSKLGEVYQLGRHRVMCGDSTSLTDAGILMNGERAGMLFTDPPYGVSYQSNGRVKTSKFEVIDNDDVILDFMPIVKEYCDGFVYVCTTWRVLDVWTELFGGYYKITNMVIWDKGGGGMGDLLKTYATDYEIILVSNNEREIVGKRYGSIWELNKKDVTKMNKKELLDIALDVKKSTSLWKQNKDAASTYVHPTQKPVSLSARAIQSSVEQGDIVLDLFLGSGSTLIACEQTDRTCFGMELDPKYVDVIRKRYWKYVNNNNEEGWEENTPAVEEK